MKTILAFLVLFITSAAQARLGETFEQCVERYGTPVARDEAAGLAEFQKGNFKITLHFFDGKSDTIDYKSTRPLNLEPDEIAAILKLYGEWKEGLDNILFHQGRTWTQASGTVAMYRPTDFRITLYTKGYIDRKEAKEKTARAQGIKGL